MLRWPERRTRQKSRRRLALGRGPPSRRSAPDRDPTKTPARPAEHHPESLETSHGLPPMPAWFSQFPPVRSASPPGRRIEGRAGAARHSLGRQVRMPPQASWSEMARPGFASVRCQSNLLTMCTPAGMSTHRVGDSHDRTPSSVFHDPNRALCESQICETEVYCPLRLRPAILEPRGRSW